MSGPTIAVTFDVDYVAETARLSVLWNGVPMTPGLPELAIAHTPGGQYLIMPAWDGCPVFDTFGDAVQSMASRLVGVLASATIVDPLALSLWEHATVREWTTPPKASTSVEYRWQEPPIEDGDHTQAEHDDPHPGEGEPRVKPCPGCGRRLVGGREGEAWCWSCKRYT